MKKLYLYFHVGSKNHGCEAIVRSTQALTGRVPVLISANPEQDICYQINQIVELQGKPVYEMSIFEKIGCKITAEFLKSEKYGYQVHAKHEAAELEEESIAMSIGGDNYCYGEAYDLYLAALNEQLHKRKIKTVLWGCSIEPSRVSEAMRKDFARYDLIVARESISYRALKECNIHTILANDPAFRLSIEEPSLPNYFVKNEIIGLNISPLIQKCETIPGITYANYEALLEHILQKTDYNVALIPHVVCEGNDDRVPLKQLYKEFEATGRVCLIEDCDCRKLKGYISKCKLFIGARTHATIAAYSTNVPTLVIGYSTKATGIAADIFGTAEHYVLPVQDLQDRQDMVKAFEWLNRHSKEIKHRLETTMPDYIKTIDLAVKELEKL